MDTYALAFSVSNLGPKSFHKLLNKFGNSEKAWMGDEFGYFDVGIKGVAYSKFDKFRKSFDIDNYALKLEKAKVTFVAFTDRQYPKRLKKLENPPIGLYCKGDLKLLDPSRSLRMTRLAVVGTRRITEYGKSVTGGIVEELVKNNVVIVSGLALGVDAKAHRTALENKGLTIAVLACGVDCCLPSENYSLYCNILDNEGLVLSEYSLLQPPNKGTFLARNRIIAALSDGVLVTEAAEDSGSLVTAEWGFKLGKKVFAVPGQITSKMSDGGLKLLKQGATLVTEVRDILDEFEILSSKSETNFKSIVKKLNLSKEEGRIVKLLENESLTIDEISKILEFPSAQLLILLSRLELLGIIDSGNGMWKMRANQL